MTDDAKKIMQAALSDAMPDSAVRQALKRISFPSGKLILVAIGKAAWKMGDAAYRELGDRITEGIIITKYEHSEGPVGRLTIREAGHPVPDENSFSATAMAVDMVSGLTENDSVLFLVSGGGSALFEQPKCSEDELGNITKQLLACGAGIVEINTIRKRLSNVKGGRFALACHPAQVFTVVLSDIIGDPLDMIASGPAYPDSSTADQALDIIGKYGITVSETIGKLLREETPKELHNVTTFVTGSVKQLCKSAAEKCRELGYTPIVLTESLSCEAKEAGSFLGSVAKDNQETKKSLAFLAGGETVVHLTGKGLGGRNQELAFAAIPKIAGCRDTCVFSFGSDGTDGPTDAAGGYADGDSQRKCDEKGINVFKTLQDNDSYRALKEIDSLIVTGPTGTNVNDLAVVLIKR